MGRKASKTKYTDRWTGITLRLKGDVKNQILEAANKKGISVNQFVLYAVWDFIQNEKGIPSPGNAQFCLPTVQEEVLAYLRGETLMKPCGKKDCQQIITQLNEMDFCGTCNLRIL
jgi:hypothetical protein